MLEYRLIQNGDVNYWEDGEESDNNGPEKEFVCVNVFENVLKTDGLAGGKTE
jgi:hypothetical protein